MKKIWHRRPGFQSERSVRGFPKSCREQRWSPILPPHSDKGSLESVGSGIASADQTNKTVAIEWLSGDNREIGTERTTARVVALYFTAREDHLENKSVIG